MPKGRPSIYPTKRNNPKLSAKDRLTSDPTSILTPVSPPGDGTLSEGSQQQTASAGLEGNSVGSRTPLARDDQNSSELEMDSDGWIAQTDAELAQAAANAQLWPLDVEHGVMDASDSDLAPMVHESRPLAANGNSNHQLHEATALSLDSLPDSWANDSVDWDHLLLPEIETCIHLPTRNNSDSTLPSQSVTTAALEDRRWSLDTGTPTDSTGSQTPLESHHSSTIISQLSQLNARIASMRCYMDKVAQAASTRTATERLPTSQLTTNHAGERNPANHAKNRGSSRLLDDAALASAATWLMRKQHHRSEFIFPTRLDDYSVVQGGGGEGGGGPRLLSSNMLQDIFSASYHFLELLECVSSYYYHYYYCSSSSSSSSTLDTTRDQLGETIRHLNIACHLLLIGIYETLLAVLEHDALLEKQTASAANDQGPLGQIQLVSVVQLCSYILARQNEAINTYVAKAQQQQQQHHHHHHHHNQYGHDNDGGGCARAAMNLEKQARSAFANELQKRFHRLECILGFGNCT